MTSASRSSLAIAWARTSDAARRVQRSIAIRVLGVLALAIVVLPGVAYSFPIIAGSDDAFIVLSGSMVPFFDPGDVIFVSEIDPSDVQVGDVLTFRVRPGSTTLITHRVIEILDDGAGPRWRTQGDANEDPDPFIVHPNMLVGRYDFQVPWWGHLVNAIRSKTGYFVLILIPAGIVIIREFIKLYRELDAADRAKRALAAASAAGSLSPPTPSPEERP